MCSVVQILRKAFGRIACSIAIIMCAYVNFFLRSFVVVLVELSIYTYIFSSMMKSEFE